MRASVTAGTRPIFQPVYAECLSIMVLVMTELVIVFPGAHYSYCNEIGTDRASDS